MEKGIAMWTKLAGWVLLVALTTGRVGAQETPRVVNFRQMAPAGQDQQWMISQGASGWMYFANTEGLIEFDGIRRTRYTLPHRQIVRAAVAAPDGRIYAGGYGEFGYWERRPADRQWHYVSLSTDLPLREASTEEIWHILALPDGVWFQSFSTIYFYDYQVVRQIEPPGNLMFAQYDGRHVVAPVLERGLYLWEWGNGFRALEGSAPLAELRMKAIQPLPGGDVLVATEREGVWRYSRDGQLRPWINQANEAFRKYQLNRILRLRDGSLAFGTILNGLYVLDSLGRFRFHLNQENGLQNNTILSLFEDAAGDLWLGLDQGADLVVLSDALRYYSDRTGRLGTAYTGAIFQNKLYIGTNQGLFRRSLAGNDPFELVEGSQGQVWELRNLPGGVLLGGHNNGAFVLKADGRLHWISDITGGWQTLHPPGRSDLLIQCTYTGLVALQETTPGNWVFSHRIEGMLAPLRQMAFDREGYLWVVHASRGLYRLRLSDDMRVISHLEEFTQHHGLPDTYAMSLTLLDDTLHFRSDNRYFRYHAADRRFVPYETRAGIPLDYNVYLLPGTGSDWFVARETNLLWMQEAHEPVYLPVRLISGYPGIKYLDDGHYLFCLRDGYALLPRTTDVKPAKAVAPQVTLVRLSGKRGDLHLLPDTSRLVIPPAFNKFSFYFTQPEFSQQIVFQHKLVGFDEQWSDWTSLDQKEYTNLPPGNYTFEVRNEWGELARVNLLVLPHWYQTTVAKIGYLLGMLLLWWAIYRLHQQRLARQKRALILERERRIQQERIRGRTEQLQADVLRKSQELANSTFSLVRKTENLLQIRNAVDQMRREQKNRVPDTYYHTLYRLIDDNLSNQDDWHIFETNFNEVHEVFFKQLMADYPELTPGDLRLAAYLKMNLNSKEIAPLLNISLRGVENKRYRLRQKLHLEPEVNLTEFLMKY